MVELKKPRGATPMNPRRALTPDIIELIKAETAAYTAPWVSTSRKEQPWDRPVWAYKASLAARQMSTYIAWVTCDTRRSTVASAFGYGSDAAVSIIVNDFEQHRLEDAKLDAFFNQLEYKIFALRRHANVATVL